MMNKNTFLSWIVPVLLLFLGSVASGEQLPQSVLDTLKHREQTLNHSAFKWNVVIAEQDSGITPKKAQEMRRSAQKEWEDRFRKQGMTDEEQIRKAAQSATESVLASLVGGTVKYSNTRTFDRDGRMMLVNGSVQSITNIVDDYIQLYDGNTTLLACNKSRSVKGDLLPVEDPSVWQSQGESVRYPSPMPLGLDLAPEHFVILTGLTPLEDRGIHWSTVSVTPSSWELEAQASQSADGAAFTVNMTLNRKYGDAPSDIRIKHLGWSEEFHVEAFRRYQDEWVVDKAVYTKSIPHLLDIYQTWNLQSITPGEPISIKLAHRNPVHDYRLLGTNLSFRRIMAAEMQHNRDIVYYPWSGRIPDTEDFKKLYGRQHPGEATPDPKSSASLPFVGGLLCLVGGVWMFKRRGVS